MKRLLLSQNYLQIDLFYGFALLFFLFLFCFFTVHLCILANVGWEVKQKEKHQSKSKNLESEEKKTPTPKNTSAQEPIYYIVEKKRMKSKPKTTYSEPKQIRFNKD